MVLQFGELLHGSGNIFDCFGRCFVEEQMSVIQITNKISESRLLASLYIAPPENRRIFGQRSSAAAGAAWSASFFVSPGRPHPTENALNFFPTETATL